MQVLVDHPHRLGALADRARHAPHRSRAHVARREDAWQAGLERIGLGFAVVLDPVRTRVVGSAGEFYWGGAASTIFWIDPAEDLVAIFMTQLLPSGTFDFRTELRQLVYQAIAD